MAHAHPDGNLSQSTSRPNHPFRSSPVVDPLSIRNPSFQPSLDRFNPNSRRLHLRNAGFRGPILPTRRITPFGSSSTVSELSSRPTNEENSPKTAEKRAIYGESLPSSPVSILQELSNSTRQRRTPRPSLVGIFEDGDAKENKPPDLAGSSWLNEAGVDSPYITRPRTPPKMATTRKSSLREKGNNPPLQSSPVHKQTKGKRKVRSNHRSTSFDASRYIEHLESELAALTTRVDALTCPMMTKAQGAKVRALTNQVRSLRLEISGWENRFEERVADEVMKRSEMEADLRRALRRLEHEKEAKDVRIQELEVEVEHAQIKAKEADSLATINHDLERRVDTLAQLLAQSSTRHAYPHPLPSPDKVAFAQRVPRPRSMLPRIPSSPVLPRRLSLNTPTSATWRSPSFHSIDNSIPETSDEGTPPKLTKDDMDESTPQANPQSRPTSESVSFGSNSHESGAISSRPTSITSSNSSTSAVWNSSHSFHANEGLKLASRARRMRRFPSGTGSLKPLILPNSVGGPSLPASAPLSRARNISSQDLSDSYFDATAAFLSIAEVANLSSPVITPSQPLRHRSTSWARTQALNALEGKPYSRGDEEDNSVHSNKCTPQTYATPDAKHKAHGCPNSEQTPPRQRLSLEFELSQLESTFNTPDVDLEQPRDVESSRNIASPLHSEHSLVNAEIPSGSAFTRFETPPFAHRHSLVSPDQPPFARNQSEPPHQSLHHRRRDNYATRRPAQGQSSITHSTESNGTVALFSRLTNLITSMRDPKVLARRILHYAWTSTTTPKAHGGLGWWLMGLVYRSCHGVQRIDLITQKTDEQDDDRFSAGRRDSNIDWHQLYSAEASKQRRVRAYTDEGGFMQNEENDQVHGSEVFLQAQSSGEENPQTSRPSEVTDPIRCKDCVEPSGRRSFRLWLRFSLAVVLAIGIAIKDGPGKLMGGDDGEVNEVKNSFDECANARDEDVTTNSAEDDSKRELEPEPSTKALTQSPMHLERDADDEVANTTRDTSMKNNDDEKCSG